MPLPVLTIRLTMLPFNRTEVEIKFVSSFYPGSPFPMKTRKQYKTICTGVNESIETVAKLNLFPLEVMPGISKQVG